MDSRWGRRRVRPLVQLGLEAPAGLGDQRDLEHQ
jgi:hypothetical protein